MISPVPGAIATKPGSATRALPGIAAEVVTRDAFILAQPLFDRGLGADPGVIHSRQPKHFKSVHPRAPRQNILNRIIQNVAEGEHAGDVRRRHHDREWPL